MTYGQTVERVYRDRKYGLSRYPYEGGPVIGAFLGVFFYQKEWQPRKALEKHSSMRAAAECEAKYINAAVYWDSFHEAAIQLRQEAINEKKVDEAFRFDVWSLIAVRYSIRVLGYRTELHCMVAENSTHAKMVLPAL